MKLSICEAYNKKYNLRSSSYLNHWFLFYDNFILLFLIFFIIFPTHFFFVRRSVRNPSQFIIECASYLITWTLWYKCDRFVFFNRRVTYHRRINVGWLHIWYICNISLIQFNFHSWLWLPLISLLIYF